MHRSVLIRWLAVLLPVSVAMGLDIRNEQYGARLKVEGATAVWCCSSGWKVGQSKPVPVAVADSITVRCARNEREAVQLVVTPAEPLHGFTIGSSGLRSEGGDEIAASQIEILRVRYVNVAQASDEAGATGLWPDPLPPIHGALELAPNENHPFWIRVSVPAGAKAGQYAGVISLAAGAWHVQVPIRLEVFDFALPDKATCTTALGFGADEAFRRHGARTVEQKRQVLEAYWRTFGAHRISPYDPAPLDPIVVQWPAAKPLPVPWADWQGGRVETNEVYRDSASLALFDDDREKTVALTYGRRIDIPPGGVRIHFAYRTAMPEHVFLVSLNHYDAEGKWLSGRNNDMRIAGDGHWQVFDREVKAFPAEARSFVLRIFATDWTEAGELTGLIWLDDVEVSDLKSGEGLTHGGDFEMPKDRPLVAPEGQLRPKVGFEAWDREMSRVL